MKRLLKEYLVTVYNKDNTRLGAYTLYGKTYHQVRGKVLTRINDGEMFTMDYKGKSVLTDWSDEY